MSIIIGSARIDENGHISGGKAGDQTGKEVSTQEFYMHSKGWYRLRPKKVEHANKLAKAMKDACANDNIGYDQTNRSAVKVEKKYGSLKNVKEKTETDCGNLVRACIMEATGKDPGDFNTGNEVEVLEKTGLFTEKKSVSSASDLANGDILVTKTKGHTAIVVSGNERKSETTKPANNTNSSKSFSSFKGKVTATSLNVRKGPGTDYSNVSSPSVIYKNKEVTVVGEEDSKSGVKWYKIKTSSNSTGFVCAKYIKRI